MSDISNNQLLKDNRVRALAAIAVVLLIWAIIATSNSGDRQDQVNALQDELSALESENASLNQQVTEIRETEGDLAAGKPGAASAGTGGH